MITRLFSCLAAVATLAAAIAAPAAAQDYPTKSITAIVPFAAGGGTDVFARLIMPAMADALGQPIEVVNRPGASSQVGMTEVATSAPDGYTIGFQIFPTSLAYLDPDRQSAYTRDSFTPIGPAFFASSVVAVRAESEYKTLADLVEAAKGNPGVLTAGTPGLLSTGHLASLGFQNATGTKFAIVNFQGGAPNRTALLGGHLTASFIAVNEALTQLERDGGRIRVLAVLADSDNPYGLPTARSQGFDIPSFAPEVGLVAPAGLDPAVQKKLSEALKAALGDAKVKAEAERIGNTVSWESPEDYTRSWIEAETKYKPLIDLAKGR